MSNSTKQHIAKWLTSLWTETKHAKGQDTAAERRRTVGIFATELATHFPADAFTDASLRAIRGEWWPSSLADLEQRIRDWYRDNAPHPVQDHGGDPAVHALGPSDRSWYNFWLTNRPEAERKEAATRESGNWKDPHQLPLAHLAALVRNMSPAAWAVISGPQPVEPLADPREISEMLGRALHGPAPAPHGATVPTRPPLEAPHRVVRQADMLAAARAANPLVQAALAAAAEQRERVQWGD